MTNTRELLSHIPADDYDEWTKVGMALKHEGEPITTWIDWSRTSDKYKEGECEKKWDSFQEGTGTIVTGGTIFALACDYGYEPEKASNDFDLNNLMLEPIIDPAFVSAERVIVPKTTKYDSIGDVREYLTTFFRPDDVIGYCVNCTQKDGRWLPTNGVYSRTRDQILSVLKDAKDFEEAQKSIGFALGTLNKDAGAYIRFNPLDGKGESNSNVTRREYCLIENDTMPIEKQLGLLKAMNLPIKMIVNSGNKSLHAIVHVDAVNAVQYRERVQILYDFCKKNGYNPDENDKNESRYSRLPGVSRGEKLQYIVERECGAKDYESWVAWVEEQNDDLPEAETLDAVFDEPTPLAPELIEGILRVGHKLLLAAPSKAGKSFLLINLAICIAEGKPWLGINVKQGKVLYVNLELDKASCEHRFVELYKAMGIKPAHLNDVIIWNLRGRAVPMNKLTPSAIRRFKNEGLAAIIIDPIYKVITGDENNATEMSVFCSYFDRLALDCNCSVIYCHHHSKGASNRYSNAVDRSSGSGVFARDPDAILDLTQLNPASAREKYLKQVETDTDPTAWEMSATLREFKPMKPTRLWFDYPLHRVDEWNFLASARYYDGGKVKDGEPDIPPEEMVEHLLKCAVDDNAVSLEVAGISRKTAFGIKGYKTVKLGETEVITKSETQTIKYLGQTYEKEGGAKNAKWVLKT